MSELLADPQEALEAALEAARAAGAGDVEVSYAGTETAFTRFAGSRFTQVGAVIEHALRVRALVEGRLGSVRCESLDPEQSRTAARAAVEAARRSPRLDVELRFATAADAGPAPTGSGDPPPFPEALRAEAAAGALAPGFERAGADGVRFAGALKAYRRRVAVMTAAGLSRRCGAGSFEAGVIADAGGASGFAGDGGRLDRAPDLAALLEDAAGRARRGVNPVEIEPGRHDVVLAPAAVAELLEWIGMVSLGAGGVLDGTSLLCGRDGERLCDPRVTLVDEPGDGDLPFDAEGTARRLVTFIDRGVAGEPVSDRLTAARLGRASTGHAPPVWSSSGIVLPQPLRLCLRPGDASEEELVGAVERGLYVTRFHYVNGLLDPGRATMTGMTRDGTFLIERGRLGRGVKNLRFTESVLEAFGRLAGIGRDLREVPSWWTDLGVVSTPALAIPGFAFTGRSR